MFNWEEYLTIKSKRKRLPSSWEDDTKMEPIEIGCGDMECVQVFRSVIQWLARANAVELSAT